MKKFGYTGEQATRSSAPAVQGHISGIVDIPNACATLCCDRSSTLISANADGPIIAVKPVRIGGNEVRGGQ